MSAVLSPFVSVLALALREERHFALVDGLPFPTQGSLVIVQVRNSAKSWSGWDERAVAEYF
jgi:hypothetical protein